MKILTLTLTLIAVGTLAAAVAHAAPDGVDFVQHAVLGPADPIQIPAGGEAVVQLDKGLVAGAEVLASDGMIRGRGTCRVLVASADIDATGPIIAQLEVGQRGEPGWTHVAGGRKSDQIPLAPVFVAPGEWLRLRVLNLDARAIDVQPGSRLSVLALDCTNPSPPIEVPQQAGGWVDTRGITIDGLLDARLVGPPVLAAPASWLLGPGVRRLLSRHLETPWSTRTQQRGPSGA